MTRFEAEFDLAFHRRVRDGFLALAAAEPGPVRRSSMPARDGRRGRDVPSPPPTDRLVGAGEPKPDPARTTAMTTRRTSRSRLRVASPADEADRAVLVRIADGELDALEDLYDRYKTMAYSIAYRITNDATLAEDVVQDAFLGAWRNAARYVEGRGSVKTWLLSIVHHRAIDAVRRRRPTTELPDVEVPPPDALHAARRLGRGRRPASTRPPSGARWSPCPTSSARRSSSPTSAG